MIDLKSHKSLGLLDLHTIHCFSIYEKDRHYKKLVGPINEI